MDVRTESFGDIILRRSFLERWLSVMLIAGSLIGLAWVLSYCRFGFEFTDESYYLVWMLNPFKYSTSANQFGFVLHPLYQLFEGDIVALRKMNVITTFGLAFLTAYLFLKRSSDPQALHLLPKAAVALSVALSSLVTFDWWLLSPSYNSLALQGIFLAVSGLLIALGPARLDVLAGCLVIGLGGWLAFMSKPTTAAALGVLTVLCWTAFVRRHYWGLLVAAVTAAALLILSAVFIDGSLGAFIGRHRDALDLYRILGAGYSRIIRIDGFKLPFSSWLLLLGLGGLIFWSHRADDNRGRISVLVCSAISFTILILVVFSLLERPLFASPYSRMIFGFVPLAAAICYFTALRGPAGRRIQLPNWPMMCLFLPLPYVYAIGTGNNYWFQGSSAAIFWVLGGLAGFGKITVDAFGKVVLPAALIIQALTMIVLNNGVLAPYRQPGPISGYSTTVKIRDSELVLSDKFAAYIEAAKAVATKSGLAQNAPIIDLTGQAPGLLYAIGAANVGMAWLSGGYPGSADMARALLNKVPCVEIGGSWVLSEPGGPREIPVTVLNSFGADLATDYESVGEIEVPGGVGGYPDPRKQILYRPSRSGELAAKRCELAKAGPPS